MKNGNQRRVVLFSSTGVEIYLGYTQDESCNIFPEPEDVGEEVYYPCATIEFEGKRYEFPLTAQDGDTFSDKVPDPVKLALNRYREECQSTEATFRKATSERQLDTAVVSVT